MKIVIIDDNRTNLTLMAALAKSVSPTEILTFEDPEAGLEECVNRGVDLVVVDYMMPKMDGVAFIEHFRESPSGKDVPVVMVTAADQKDVRRNALQAGATDFLSKPVDTIETKLRLGNLLQLRHAQILVRDRAALLAEEVRRATSALRTSGQELINRLAEAAEFRDPETGAHIQRMAHYSVVIARKMGMNEDQLQDLLSAAPLHDIGKVGIPDRILLKPGKLIDDEMDIMRSHATIGEQLLSGSKLPLIQMACEIAGAHHEKWDGSGYPRGLKGEEIPLSGRIVALADVLDALTSERPYKKAWTFDDARDFIIKGRGSHFCPSCVDALMDTWNEVLEVRKTFPD